MEYQKKREENEKRQRLFDQLAAVEERLMVGAAAGGSSHDATEAILTASTLLNNDFVLTDIKSANRELDFCENALATCSDGVGGVISLKDIMNAFDKQFGDFCAEEGNDLKKYCLTYSSFFVTCPPWFLLKIALENLNPRPAPASHDATQEEASQAKKGRKKAAQTEAAEAERQAAAGGADEVVDDDEERDQETVKELHRLHKSILDELHMNSDSPIDYWRFVFDPTSKGKTFMNMLHVNHILQNKEIALVESDKKGELFLWKTSLLVAHAQTGGGLRTATISFILTDQKYQELVRRYGDAR